MAILTNIHCNMSVITKTGEDINIRPLIDGKDVTIIANKASGNHAQALVDGLGKTAFLRKFDGVDDSKGFESETCCYSVDKINSVVDNANSILASCEQDYSGWF